jgi:hypothetical protein
MKYHNSIISLPIEVSDHAFDAAGKAFSTACETRLYGCQFSTTVSGDKLPVYIPLTIPFNLGVVLGEAQKEPNNLENGYYKRPESDSA